MGRGTRAPHQAAFHGGAGGSPFRGTQDTFQPCFGAGMSVWESDEASQYLLLSVLAALRRDFTPDPLSSSIRTWLCCKLGSFISPDTSLFCPAYADSEKLASQDPEVSQWWHEVLSTGGAMLKVPACFLIKGMSGNRDSQSTPCLCLFQDK